MKVEFFDRQDDLSPHNGKRITTAKELLKIFESSRNRKPFFCELVGENGYNLLVGVGREVGCVQYSSSNGDPPYLMVTSTGISEDSGDVKFLIGGTPTPVPKRYCVPFETVKKVVTCFIESGTQSHSVRWDEIRSRSN